MVESADSIPELADYATNSVIVGQLSLLNMFNGLNPLDLANGNRPTIAVGRREISPVGTGLKSNSCLESHALFMIRSDQDRYRP